VPTVSTRQTLLDRHSQFFPKLGQWGRLVSLSYPATTRSATVNSIADRVAVTNTPIEWTRGTKVKVSQTGINYYLIPTTTASEWQLAATPEVGASPLSLQGWATTIDLLEQPASPEMTLDAILAREVLRSQVTGNSPSAWLRSARQAGGGYAVSGVGRVWLVGSTIPSTAKSTQGVIAAFLDSPSDRSDSGNNFDARVFSDPIGDLDRNDYRKGGVIRAGTGNYSPWIVCASTLDDPAYYYFLDPGESTATWTGYPNTGLIDLFINGVFDSAGLSALRRIDDNSIVTTPPAISGYSWVNPYQQLVRIYNSTLNQTQYALPGGSVLMWQSNTGWTINGWFDPVTIDNRNLPKIGQFY
jgi:hypothetical protein